MNKKLMASIIILGFLVSVVSAYGFTFVPPPQRQSFMTIGGFVYAVEYECGVINPDTDASAKGAVLPGFYATNILLHNNQPPKTGEDQFVYIKILDGFNNLSLWVTNPNTGQFRFVIQPDGLLDIDCAEIQPLISNSPNSMFTKGFIIISHPTRVSTPLDVAASYTFEALSGSTIVGGSKNVVYISGEKVAEVPAPCVPFACHTLPP